MVAQERNRLAERIQQTTDRLADEFKGSFSYETVSRCVEESTERLTGARLLEYLPVLIYRFARERLLAQAQVAGLIKKERPEILFVCVHNAGRSQMAAGLATSLSGGRVGVRSAGSMPANAINPTVRRVMAEVGIDLEDAFPKPLTDDVVEAADVVITMGCGDACPVYPGKRYLDWELTDPSSQPEEVVRAVREEITARIKVLLAELEVEVTAP